MWGTELHPRETDYSKNDVSPKNIIVQGDLLNGRAFLVDFGCASGDDADRTGFVGTPMYAHVDVYHQYPGKKWKPKSEYDFFSQGLSLSSLVGPSSADWDMGRFPRSLSDDAKKELAALNTQRVESATVLAQKSGCQKGIRDNWLHWLNGT